MHQQNLMLLHPMVKEKMHLQENTLFDLDIMWPMHQHNLILLHRTVKEKMHLQENTLFDLQVKVTWNVAQCHLHHVTYAPTEFDVTTSKTLGEKHLQENSMFDLDPLGWHHVTYNPATKFEVATSNCLGGDTFTRKYSIWSLTLTLGSRSHEM